jgi:hypothetical protein
MVRIDNFFSIWIFLWYIFYIFKYISYSPKIAFIIAIIQNIVIFILLFYEKIVFNHGKYIFILLFLCIMGVIKIFPLYTIRKDSIHWKDFYFLFFLFALYNGWLYLQDQNMIDLYIKSYNDIIDNTKDTPLLFTHSNE